MKWKCMLSRVPHFVRLHEAAIKYMKIHLKKKINNSFKIRKFLFTTMLEKKLCLVSILLIPYQIYV